MWDHRCQEHNANNLSVAYNRMLLQWKGFPTTLQETLLKVIRLGIIGHCQLHGKVVRWEQAESYKVDQDELDEYANDVAEELRSAEETHLIPYGFFNEGSPTLPDTGSPENGMGTIVAENEGIEDEQGMLSDRSDRWMMEDEDAVEYTDGAVEDTDGDGGNAECADSDNGDDDNDGAGDDEDQDGESDGESEDNAEDVDLEDNDDDDGEPEDADSEDEL